MDKKDKKDMIDKIDKIVTAAGLLCLVAAVLFSVVWGHKTLACVFAVGALAWYIYLNVRIYKTWGEIERNLDRSDRVYLDKTN